VYSIQENKTFDNTELCFL